jgi:hypothetical protein
VHHCACLSQATANTSVLAGEIRRRPCRAEWPRGRWLGGHGLRDSRPEVATRTRIRSPLYLSPTSSHKPSGSNNYLRHPETDRPKGSSSPPISPTRMCYVECGPWPVRVMQGVQPSGVRRRCRCPARTRRVPIHRRFVAVAPRGASGPGAEAPSPFRTRQTYTVVVTNVYLAGVIHGVIHVTYLEGPRRAVGTRFCIPAQSVHPIHFGAPRGLLAPYRRIEGKRRPGSPQVPCRHADAPAPAASPATCHLGAVVTVRDVDPRPEIPCGTTGFGCGHIG